MVHLDRLSDLTGIELPVDEYDTLNGFLIGQLGRIPAVTDKPEIEYEGLVFKAEKVDEKRISLVKVCKA
jgi:putative hemolysin